MTFTFTGEQAGWTSLGAVLLVALILARTIRENGIFCLTPCGPHACIIDTNQGNSASVRALALLREELREQIRQEIEDSLQQNTHNLEEAISQHSTYTRNSSTPGSPSLAQAVRDHANVLTEQLNSHFENKRIRMCTVS